MDEMKSHRVFISYSHQDKELVKKIEKVIRDNGMTPMLDEDFAFGHGFQEQIMTFVAHAHVFLPVITEASSARGWVHQEIGYAMAHHIPVLPVALGALPGEMIQQLHAVTLSEDLHDLRDKLSKEVFDNLVKRYQDSRLAFFQCAEEHEERTAMMTQYANDVTGLGKHGLIRQKGGLSSFNIPAKIVSHLIWKERYEPISKSQYYCRLQREERVALEEHVRESGCHLIINPYQKYEAYSVEAIIVRLKTLLEFLESMPDDKVQVAIAPELRPEESFTIVGDWFVAECISTSSGHGYRQTIFTRHAPTVWSKIEFFDEGFKELLKTSGWTAESSKAASIEAIHKVINGLKSNP